MADNTRARTAIQTETRVQTGIRRTTEAWRDHIIHQLKNRDQNQHAMFQDLIRFYSRLLERNNLTSGVLNLTRRPLAESSSLLHQKHLLNQTCGELSFQVVELQQKLKVKQDLMKEQQSRLTEAGQRQQGALGVRVALQGRVERLQQQNGALKVEYDALLQRQQGAESRLREENLRGGALLENLNHLTEGEGGGRKNSLHLHRSRTEPSAARSKVKVDSRSGATSPRSSSPPHESLEEPGRRTRLFRSFSVTSPRIFFSFKRLFDRKRRGHSVCSHQEPLVPARTGVPSRVPARALQVLEAHEQGINAVRFSCSSTLVATGGTDRLLKLWDVRADSLSHRATLEGSTEGITCIDFDRTGSRVLAASYDKSALLWQLDDCLPKVTLTGHSRKVTAARFYSLHQVATGSADRTVRVWDLHRAACVQQVEVTSYCSDLVSSENYIITGHYDCKIRVWDSRAASVVLQLPAPGKVTSLDLGVDQRLLLSCCRDDCLQLHDLRRWSLSRWSFRAEGFTCGSDSTKAVISPDGGYVAVGSADGAVYIWNVSAGTLETRLPGRHSSSISALSWSSSGQFVVSVDRSRRAVLWSDM